MNIFKSAKTVLYEYFGKIWWIYSLIILVILFLPSIVLWNSIEFDSARFVEEWIKIGVVGILIFLIIEIGNYKRKASNLSRKIAQFIEVHYIGPLNNLRNDIISFKTDLQLSKDENVLRLTENISRNWAIVFKQDTFAIPDIIPDIKFVTEVTIIVRRFNFERVNNLILTLIEKREYADINLIEFEEIVKTVTDLFSELEKLKENWRNL